MKHFRGRKFITLNEWLDIEGNTLPSGITLLTHGGAVPFSAADLFVERYGERYISEPVDEATGLPEHFSERLTTEAARLYSFFKDRIDGVDRMLTDLYADGTEETLEYKRAPNGATNFASAYSDGGTIRNATGLNSGNIDRIIKAQTELRDLWDMLAEGYSCLFMGARFGWGCDE